MPPLGRTRWSCVRRGPTIRRCPPISSWRRSRTHVVDPAGVLYKMLATHPQVRYLRVGAPPDIRVRRTAEAGVVAAAPRGEWAPGGEPAVSGDVREGTR